MQYRHSKEISPARLRTLVAVTLCFSGLFLAAVGLAGPESWLSPMVFGGSDVNVITGAETSPRVTQGSSASWGNGNTIVVALEDSSGSPASYCGVSVSTDGGATFARQAEKFNAGGACYGYPSVVYKRAGREMVCDLSLGSLRQPGTGPVDFHGRSHVDAGELRFLWKQRGCFWALGG